MRFGSRFGVSALTVVVAVGLSPLPVHADGTREDQWMLDALRVAEAHEVTKGEGVTVGIVDSGVDASHPDVKGNVEAGWSSWDGGQEGLKDTIGHGTAMASLIAGHGHGDNKQDGVLGVAPEATVKSVSVFPEKGQDATAEATVSGIRWLADKEVDVILVASGGAHTDPLKDVVEYAVESKDIPMVASEGNTSNGPGGDLGPQTPARYDEVFGITGSTKDGKFWDGSVEGMGAKDVMLAAPAEDVVHAWTGHGYDDVSGTSDSAAIVAGVVALMKAQWPDMAWEDIQWRLSETADDKGKQGPDKKFGWGIVNPVEALTAHVEPPEGIPDEQINPNPNPKPEPTDDSSKDDQTLTGDSSGPGPVLWWSIAAAAAIVAATVIAIVIIRRRNRITRPTIQAHES